MYSWGSDTSDWRGPGSYAFDSAKAPYLDKLKKDADEKGPRTYVGNKKGPKLELVDPKNKDLVSTAEDVIIVGVDGTGSMKTWPREIFDRLPLFYQTLATYRPDLDVSFSVIGDAKWDQWPAQVGNFGKALSLEDTLNALHPEGGGGPGIRESYELWGYFVNEHVKTPNAKNPLLILMGDEKFYDNVDPGQIKKYLGRDVQGPISSMDVWHALANRFDIFFLRKEYAGHDEEVVAQWAEAIGEQRVIPVYDPLRVVDVAMGIVAKRWGYETDFEKNLAARQDDANVEKVQLSLRAADAVLGAEGKSVLKSKATGAKSKSLVGVEK